jgi:glycosyltransferase involved in cell wall biosynthesis
MRNRPLSPTVLSGAFARRKMEQPQKTRQEPVPLSIIIPARNEEQTLGKTIDAFEEVAGPDWELIIVDDHSTDGTWEVIQKKNRQYGNIIGVKNTATAGFANALWAGFKRARGQFLLPVMADLCDDPESAPRMLTLAQQGYDVVCASRYMRGGQKQGGPLVQGFFSRLVCLLLKVWAQIPTCDASNSYKMYRRSMLLGLRTTAKGFALSIELLARMLQAGARITELPTTWQSRKEGRSKFKISAAIRDYLPPFLLMLKRNPLVR